MSSRKYALKGEMREKAGKGVARALRRESQVPAVIYGDGKPAVSITLSAKDVNLEYKKGHMYTSICNFAVGKEEHMLLVRDVQLHPVTDIVLHVDFLRVTPKTKIRVHVPVKFINEEECKGITAEGGVLNAVLHEVDLMCVATDIPDHIDVDVSPYALHDVIKISNIKLPAGVTPAIKGRDVTLATIMEPRRFVEEVVAPAEGDAAAAGADGAAPAAGAAAPAAGAAAAKKPEAKK